MKFKCMLLAVARRRYVFGVAAAGGKIVLASTKRGEVVIVK